jgi:hypothetical protein
MRPKRFQSSETQPLNIKLMNKTGGRIWITAHGMIVAIYAIYVIYVRTHDVLYNFDRAPGKWFYSA